MKIHTIGNALERVKKSRSVLSLLLIVVCLAAMPFFLGGQYYVWMITSVFFYAILAGSWDILVGYARLFSFAHTGLMIVGAYGSALIWRYVGLDPIISIVIGACLASLMGGFIGTICLRLKGLYLALATWGFSFIALSFVLSFFEITRGSTGFNVPFFLGLRSFEAPLLYYFAFLSVFALFLVMSHALVRSKRGLFLKAIGDDEEAASSRGVDVVKLKVTVFTFTSFWVGLAGALYVHYLGYVSPAIGDFFSVMLIVMAISIVGGLGTLYGPVLGSFLIYLLWRYIQNNYGGYQPIVFSIVIIVFLRFFSGGLAGAFKSLYTLLRSRNATKV